MANFKTHVSTGIFIGITSSILISLFGLSKNILIILISFFAVLIGSFLPDIDSDTSKPYQIIISFLSLLTAILVFYYLFQRHITSLVMLILIPITSFVFVKIIIGKIFKKITRHRGIWHSIPYAMVIMLLSLLIWSRFNIEPSDNLIISLSFGIGYLGHLILDEIYSFVNIDGIQFIPKKSLGSALKFSSTSKITTIVTYLLILILLYLSFPLILSYVSNHKN